MNKVSEEIQEAMELFECYRDEKDHEKRNEEFRSALENIRDFIEDYPNSEYINHAVSYRKNYIHIFLKELPSLHYLDIDDWSFYLITIVSWKEVFEKEMENHPHFKENYQKYIEVWREEAIEILSKKL